MQALHKFPENPTKISSQDTTNHFAKLDEYYHNLKTYLIDAMNDIKQSSFEEHEQVITTLTHTLGCEALSSTLQHYDPCANEISVDNQVYRQHSAATKTYQTVMGPITLQRHLYINRKHDGDGKTICPLEWQAGLIEGYWTPTAAKHSAFALAHLTPQETETLLLRLNGMTPSRSSLDRLPKALQKHWQAQENGYYDMLLANERIPQDATSVAISLDGVMVAMKANNEDNATIKPKQCDWREASCGTVSFFDKQGERLSTIQYGQMPEHKKATLKKRLIKHVEAIQVQRPELNRVYLADGAQDNWTFFDEDMPLGVQVTDFYHACQYIKLAFDAAYKDKPDKAVEKYQHYRHVLRHEHNGINKLLRAIRHLRCQHRTNEAIQKALTYFQNNQHRMDYANIKEKNYPIGSGVVEAACKTLVGQRLKRSGMSWCHDGGQAILNLRALAKSYRFDSAWKLLAENYKKSVKVHDNVISFSGESLN